MVSDRRIFAKYAVKNEENDFVINQIESLKN